MTLRKLCKAKPYPTTVLQKSRPPPQWLARRVHQWRQKSESACFLSRSYIRDLSRVLGGRHSKLFLATGVSARRLPSGFPPIPQHHGGTDQPHHERQYLLKNQRHYESQHHRGESSNPGNGNGGRDSWGEGRREFLHRGSRARSPPRVGHPRAGGTTLGAFGAGDSSNAG